MSLIFMLAAIEDDKRANEATSERQIVSPVNAFRKSLVSAAAALIGALLLIAGATSAFAESPEPINPNISLLEAIDPVIPPAQGPWTMVLNIYGYKYGGPIDLTDLSLKTCTTIMEQVNDMDVRTIRRALGDDESIRGANAIACVNTYTGEMIWP